MSCLMDDQSRGRSDRIRYATDLHPWGTCPTVQDIASKPRKPASQELYEL